MLNKPFKFISLYPIEESVYRIRTYALQWDYPFGSVDVRFTYNSDQNVEFELHRDAGKNLKAEIRGTIYLNERHEVVVEGRGEIPRFILFFLSFFIFIILLV
jgi:hypothetical protein